MATPSPKVARIAQSLDAISQKMFGRPRRAMIEDGLCVTCGGDATKFNDTLSRKEYSISGMCQKCQDKMFDYDDEPEPYDYNEPAF